MNKELESFKPVADGRPNYRPCKAVLDVLMEIMEVDILNLPDSPILYVGSAKQHGYRIKAYIVGVTRIDGGLVLLTATRKGSTSRWVYFIDDLYRQLESNRPRGEQMTKMLALIVKAVAKRNQALMGTTNYFSGITGKVIKIL